MKASSFFAGIAVGAAAAVALSKKLKFCKAEGEESCEGNPALKDAENAVETLRSSVEILRKELNTRIESEQTYASQCEELKDKVAKKDVEIDNLKNICEKQDGVNKKLEEELAEARTK